MGDWPDSGLCHEMQHRVFGVEHLLPAQVFVIPDVLGRPQGSHGANSNGVLKLSECKGVVADRLAGVETGLSATSQREVVKLNILQGIDLVEGIRGRPWLNPFVDATVWVEGVQLRLFLFGLPALLFCFFFKLSTLNVLLLLGYSVPFFLVCSVLLELGIPSDYSAMVFSGPVFLHSLVILFCGQALNHLLITMYWLPLK